MKTIRLVLILTIPIILLACSSQKSVESYYNFDIECLSVDLDGSQVLLARGEGENRGKAVEQAKKLAVRDVLFKGIYSGKQECSKIPVLPEVNIQQKNELYFNEFFSENGDYKNYVSQEKKQLKERLTVKQKNSNGRVVTTIVLRVQRAKLKLKMINDGILK